METLLLALLALSWFGIFRCVVGWKEAEARARMYEAKAAWLEAREQKDDGRVEDALKARDRAISQVQDLAQQLATLRVRDGADPESRVYETAEPDKPYSAELRDFLDGIVNHEARTIIEEEIDYHRSQGLVDSQILSIVSQDDSR